MLARKFQPIERKVVAGQVEIALKRQIEYHQVVPEWVEAFSAKATTPRQKKKCRKAS